MQQMTPACWCQVVYADRQLVTVAKKDIEEMQKSARSLMPDGVLADLTAAEAADLLAFVKSLAEASK